MQETPADLAQLDALLSHGIATAGPFLRSSFQMPQCSMSAAQVVAVLQRVVVVSFATVTAGGEPRIAPIGALFWRGRFYIPTTMEAARTRHVRKRPAVSLTWYDGTDRAIIVHGVAEPLGVEHADFATLDGLYQQFTAESVTTWGTGAYLCVSARQFFTFDRANGTPSQEP